MPQHEIEKVNKLVGKVMESVKKLSGEGNRIDASLQDTVEQFSKDSIQNKG